MKKNKKKRTQRVVFGYETEKEKTKKIENNEEGVEADPNQWVTQGLKSIEYK
ncbi:hypothetical protein Dsin_022503 [Dipteronia sinensis]|uniref:Uncharacterized protein n=1 Tax=Dipteronia sinensis TaxID=43782 RepID=A0AAE0DZV1_9ROSI|nr:hypothetical protein Dsin_022503 [Dipteronia sinensis]